MHKTIKRFGLEGTLTDKDIPRLRAQFESLVTGEMRDEGYVPVFGLGPFWSTAYDKDSDNYTFILSMHGYYVGRKKVCTIKGISAEGRIIPHTVPSK